MVLLNTHFIGGIIPYLSMSLEYDIHKSEYLSISIGTFGTKKEQLTQEKIKKKLAFWLRIIYQSIFLVMLNMKNVKIKSFLQNL